MNQVANYTDYFRSLAIAHHQLQHNTASETGDVAVGEKAFACWGVEEALTDLRTKIGSKALLLEMFEELTTSEIVYDIRGNLKGAFTIVEKASSKLVKDEIAAQNNTYTITKQMLNKIWIDHYGNGVNRCNTPFKDVDFNGLNIMPVGPILNGLYFGWRVEFTFSFQENEDLTTPLQEGIFI